jgi:hypothetical protein
LLNGSERRRLNLFVSFCCGRRGIRFENFLLAEEAKSRENRLVNGFRVEAKEKREMSIEERKERAKERQRAKEKRKEKRAIKREIQRDIKRDREKREKREGEEIQ